MGEPLPWAPWGLDRKQSHASPICPAPLPLQTGLLDTFLETIEVPTRGRPGKGQGSFQVHVCLQECKISHFTVKQRGQSGTGKVTIGLQCMKFGSFAEKGSASQMCRCSCSSARASPDLMKLDIK